MRYQKDPFVPKILPFQVEMAKKIQAKKKRDKILKMLKENFLTVFMAIIALLSLLVSILSFRVQKLSSLVPSQDVSQTEETHTATNRTED